MAKVNTYNNDEDLTLHIDRTFLQKIMHYLRPYKGKFAATILISLLSAAAFTATPFLLQVALDKMIPDKNIRGLVILGVLCTGLFLFSVWAENARSIRMNYMGHSIIHDLRCDLFEHLQKLPVTYFDTRPHGKILVRVVNYVNSLADMFANGLVNALTEMVSLVIILAFMFAVNVRLTLISLIGLPILVIFISKLRSIHHRAWQAYSDKNSNLNAYLHENINGVRITQAFVQERASSRIFSRLSADTLRAWMRAKVIECTIYPASTIISELSVSVIYFLGAAAIAREELTVGVIVAIVSYIRRFWGPINNMSSIYNQLMTNLAYLERIFEVMDEDTVIKDAPDAGIMPDVKGDVAFSHVTFGYDAGEPILQDLSFQFPAGTTVALVGQTGAGKSTVANLLGRYYDIQGGTISIDGIDIRSVTVKSLREQLGFMLQDSFVFSGSLMDNIRYGRLEATDQEVIAAAKAVGAHDFIAALPDGYQTVVSERGSMLSAGQQQLISLARAMLKNPRILVLDEATSSIDTETEIKIMEGISAILQNRTSFVIAHRLSTIKSADVILVIGNKGIIERGSHEELLALDGEYAKLYRTQTSLT